MKKGSRKPPPLPQEDIDLLEESTAPKAKGTKLPFISAMIAFAIVALLILAIPTAAGFYLVAGPALKTMGKGFLDKMAEQKRQEDAVQQIMDDHEANVAFRRDQARQRNREQGLVPGTLIPQKSPFNTGQ